MRTNLSFLGLASTIKLQVAQCIVFGQLGGCEIVIGCGVFQCGSNLYCMRYVMVRVLTVQSL
jgi:hypothetical protein